jgi:hypothetical protein
LFACARFCLAYLKNNFQKFFIPYNFAPIHQLLQWGKNAVIRNFLGKELLIIILTGSMQSGKKISAIRSRGKRFFILRSFVNCCFCE